MKYASLDLETTCLSEMGPHNIIGLSVVVEDSSVRGVPVNYLPHFTCLIDQGWFSGEPYALQMNARYLKLIAQKKQYHMNPYPIYDRDEWVGHLHTFLDAHFGNQRITLAGKNVASFDYQFLPKCVQKRCLHRMIDVGSVFIDWNRSRVPNMSEVFEMVGIDKQVAHDMREDAMDNISVLRTKYTDPK